MYIWSDKSNVPCVNDWCHYIINTYIIVKLKIKSFFKRENQRDRDGLAHRGLCTKIGGLEIFLKFNLTSTRSNY